MLIFSTVTGLAMGLAAGASVDRVLGSVLPPLGQFAAGLTTAAVAVWKWPLALVAPVAALFFALDSTFVVSNAHKIPQGGWFPLLVEPSR